MYASTDDLKKRLKRAYEDIYLDNATGLPDESLMQEDLEAANAEIDGSIAARYSIPVTKAEALPLLKSWTLTLAEELAWSRVPADDIPEHVKKRVDTVREKLKFTAAGTFRLPAAPAETENSVGGAVSIQIAEPVFTREKMEGF